MTIEDLLADIACLATPDMERAEESRVRREQLLGMAVDSLVEDRARVVAEHEQMRQAFESRNQTVSTLLRDKERLSRQVDELTQNLVFWRKTSKNLPAVGLTCDTKDCGSVIGVSGLREFSPSMVPSCEQLGACDGWVRVYTPGQHSHDEDRVEHFCPTCARDRRGR